MMVLWPLNLVLSASERGKQLVHLPTVMIPLVELGNEVIDVDSRSSDLWNRCFQQVVEDAKTIS